MMFSIGFLAGLNTVFEVMDDDVFSGFVQTAIYEEILPMLPQDEETKVKFAKSVLDRFKNPFVKHYLEEVGLNSFFKYRTRVVPILSKWVKEKGQIPPLMSFSLAALIMYYKPQGLIDDQHMIGRRKEGEYKIRDSKECIQTLYEAWKVFDHSKQNINDVVKRVLQNNQLWGEDLNNIVKLHEVVCAHLGEILNKGMKKSIINILEKYPIITNSPQEKYLY
jgi:tagaturonate reductase